MKDNTVNKREYYCACSNCKFVELSGYIFEDLSRSIVCTRYNKFLGFTNKNGDIVETKGVLQCEINPITNNSNKQKEKVRTYGKSGVKYIHWHTSCKKWKIRYYDKNTNKVVIVGSYSKLDEAKAALEEYIKTKKH